MPYIIILIGFFLLLYVISRYMKSSNSPRTNKIFRYGFAIVLGLLAYFFLAMAKNIPIGGILALLSFLSARGTLWRFLINKEASQAENSTSKASNNPAKMTREEALDVLGLTGTPSKEEIKEAHLKMMLKVHPDQGGSDYLASKLNQARDMLL